MKPKLFLPILVAVLLAGGAQAQYTGDNQSNTISGVASNWVSTAYFVGQNWVNDALVIQAGGVLSNGFAYIGYEPGADFNTVLVTDPGSAWSNANDLSVGYLGALNSMTVSNGGAVNNADGYIGNQYDDNAVLVIGSGSVWSNANDLYVGNLGAENSLTIASGGTVYDSDAYIGNQTRANANTVLVSDPGSVWNNDDELFVGLFDSGNSLTITNGGAVLCGYGGVIGESGNFNTVLVTGTGSIWSVGYFGLAVGTGGSGNSLTIASGGEVYSGNGVIGQNAGGYMAGPGINNTVLVTGSGSMWNISFGGLSVGSGGSDNSLTISNGGYVMCTDEGVIGGDSSTNNTVVVADDGTLVVSNGGFGILVVSPSGGPDSLVLNGGSVTVDGLVLTNGLNSIIAFNAGHLTSSGTSVTNNQGFVVGDGTDAATFHLNGGFLTFSNNQEISSNAFLTGCGYISGTVLVDAGGTMLADCGGTLNIFGSVTNNGSIIATNGTVINFYGTVINNGQIGPTNNVHYYPTVPSLGTTNSWISPASDKWEAGADWSAGPPSIIQPAVYITNASSKTVTMDFITAFAFTNTLTISNLTVSGPSGSTNTLLLSAVGVSTPLQIVSNLTVNAGGIVTVANSALEVDNSGVVPGTSGLFIGVNSAGEQLSVHGGQINDTYAYLGFNSTSSNNTALVSGAGSVWTNGNDLEVGLGGAGNTVIIANGAVMYNGYGNLGYNSTSLSNIVVVTDPGSVWNNLNNLHVGANGPGNTLTIINSGLVNDAFGVVGGSSSSSNNSASVSGAGSVWSNQADLWVGDDSPSNQVVIANAAVVACSGAVLVGIGTNSVANSIIITNGGRLTSAGTCNIGAYDGTSGSSNFVLVTGPGSTWVSAGFIRVGDGRIGQGNELLIEAGGSVMSSNALIGDNGASLPSESNNGVLVTDLNSIWTINGTLGLGNNNGSSGNWLTISNGGYVACSAGGIVGSAAGSSNNTVTIVGGSLVVTNAAGNATLVISQAGGADSLVLNSGSVTVNQLVLTNGLNSVVALNGGWLTSSGTSVTNSQLFVVGDGSDTATYQLNGGVHSFANNLEISSNAFLARLRHDRGQHHHRSGRHLARQLRRNADLHGHPHQQRHDAGGERQRVASLWHGG